MENPSESGAGDKPKRASARSGSTTRKTTTAKRPAAKRPAAKTAAAKVAPVVVPDEVDAAATVQQPAASESAASVAVAVETAPEPDVDVELTPEPEPEPDPEPEPEPQPALDAASEPEEADDAGDEETRERPVITEAADPGTTGDAPAAPSPLAGIAGWTRRVTTVTGATVDTLGRSTAAALRAGAAAAAQRRAEAAARAEAARAERAEAAKERAEAAQQLALLEATTPRATVAELQFDLIAPLNPAEHVLAVHGLTKSFGDKVAVAGIDLRVHPGAFYGIVGPNGAGKTTTLSMISGLLRPDVGTVHVHGSDVWNDPVAAKRNIGVLPDRLRLFDRLTGAQLLYYAGVLRGLDGATVKRRTADLAAAFGLEQSLGRLVSDYSAGMTKKIALAAAMIHSPRLLVLDEPFESVDPVSASNVTRILKQYVAAGGTVVLSSHSMDLVQRICDHVAVVVGGVILADGTIDAVRDGRTLEERFIELAGRRTNAEGMEWLHSFSD